MRGVWSALAVLVIAGGCEKTNAAYCERDEQCAPGQTCDTIARQCQGGALDLSVPDGGALDLASGGGDMPQGCAVACSGATPICAAPACVGCDTVANPEAACAAIDGKMPHCLGAGDAGTGGGACVACRDNADCTADPLKPTCDAATHACRRCRSGADCASGVCDLYSSNKLSLLGACVDASQVLYVDIATCPNNGADGSAGAPYCAISTALGALGGKTVLHVGAAAGGSTYNNHYTIGTNLTIVGELDANNQPLATVTPGNNTGVVVSGTNVTVTIYGLTIENAGGGGHSGVACQTAGMGEKVRVIRSVLQQNNIWGLDGTNCDDVYLDASLVTANGAGGGGGAMYLGKNALVTNNFIVGNGKSSGNDTGGVTINTQVGDSANLFNNTIADNQGGTALTIQGVHCVNASVPVLINDLLYNNHFVATPYETDCTNSNNGYLASDGPEGLNAGAHNVALSGANPPNFVVGGYHLQATGPCIDTGFAGANMPDHDVDFEPRPNAKTMLFDIGADEVQ